MDGGMDGWWTVGWSQPHPLIATMVVGHGRLWQVVVMVILLMVWCLAISFIRIGADEPEMVGCQFFVRASRTLIRDAPSK